MPRFRCLHFRLWENQWQNGWIQHTFAKQGEATKTTTDNRCNLDGRADHFMLAAHD